MPMSVCYWSNSHLEWNFNDIWAYTDRLSTLSYTLTHDHTDWTYMDPAAAYNYQKISLPSGFYLNCSCLSLLAYWLLQFSTAMVTYASQRAPNPFTIGTKCNCQVDCQSSLQLLSYFDLHDRPPPCIIIAYSFLSIYVNVEYWCC